MERLFDALGVTGEYGPRHKAALAKKYKELGPVKFDSAVAEVADAQRAGKAQNPGRLLMYILGEWASGRRRNP